MEGINSGDTAWVLMATTLVLMMTPALAFFYGGMVRKKNVLSTLNASFIMMALISIQWLLFGFTLAFGNSSAASSVGSPISDCGGEDAMTKKIETIIREEKLNDV